LIVTAYIYIYAPQPSIMIRQRRRSAVAKPASPNAAPTSPTRLHRLWLQSRTLDGVTQRPLTARRLDRANLKVCLALLRFEVTAIFKMFGKTNRLVLGRYIIGELVVALAPAAKVSTMASLMNLVQETLSSTSPVSPYLVAWHAVLTLAAYSAGQILPTLARHDSGEMKRSLDQVIQIDYIRRKLSLDIPVSVDPIISALARESAVFAGFEYMEFDLPGGDNDGFYSDGPFSLLRDTFFAVLISLIEFASTATLLSIICLDIIQNPVLGFWTSLAWITVVLVLAFLPIVLGSLVSALISVSLGTPRIRSSDHDHGFWMRREGIKSLIQDTTNREEIVLFGLAEWIASKWSAVNHLQKRREDDSRTWEWKNALQQLVQESGQVVFYVSARLPTRLLFMG
jgi:hypothetical protein